MSVKTEPTVHQVGIVLVTHVDYGSSLLKAAEFIIGPVQDCVCIQVDAGQEVEETVARLKDAIRRLSTGHGVLILTDMFGGTPTNLSLSLLGTRTDVDVVTGVNLPMLLKVLGQRRRTLEELSEMAITAGIEGIIAAGKMLNSRVATPHDGKEQAKEAPAGKA